MTRELQQFEKLDVSVDSSDAYLDKIRKDCILKTLLLNSML